MNTRSIHFRLIILYSGVVTLISVILGAYEYQSLNTNLYAEMARTLDRRAHSIAENILANGGDSNPETVATKIDSVYSPENNDRFIRILRKDHSVMYVSGQPKERSFDPAKIPIPKGNIPAKRLEQIAPSINMFITTLEIKSGNQNFLIEMGAPTDEIERELRNFLFNLLLCLSVTILLISAGGYALIRRSLKPVEDIRATAERITFGNLRNRLPVVKTGDAMEHLSVTLNQMLERLDEAYQQSSRFSADASHELCTPLTIMRGELEALLKENLPENIIGSVGSILEEVERLSHIAESLSAISSLDSGEAKMQNLKFDLADLVKTTTEQMQLLAEEKSITLKVDAVAEVDIKGDPGRLKQIVVNLLGNAIKYTPDKGRIYIKVFTHEHKAMAVLEVKDNGIGIAAEALPHIFERFYRADKVRSRELGGSGLGLSIVRSICQAHGGSVDIQSVEGKGTTCRVEIPLANGHDLKG